MQPYFDPARKTTSKTMEDDLKKIKRNGRLPQNKNGRRPQQKMKMEDNLILFLKTRMTI